MLGAASVGAATGLLQSVLLGVRGTDANTTPQQRLVVRKEVRVDAHACRTVPSHASVDSAPLVGVARAVLGQAHASTVRGGYRGGGVSRLQRKRPLRVPRVPRQR
jgi:hypothetical protein